MGRAYGRGSNAAVCRARIRVVYIPYTVEKFYGPKNYSVNFGIASFLLIPSAIFGPMVSSALYENSGGTYHTTFLFVISLAAFSFVMGLFVTKFSPDEKTRVIRRANSKAS